MASKKPESAIQAAAVGPGDGALVTIGNLQVPAILADYRLFDTEAMAIYQENLGDEPLQLSDLVRVKVPAGGATAWEVPTLEGDDESVKEIQGIIVADRYTRAYWQDEFSGAKVRPDCSSNDGKFGNGDPGGMCATCPMAQFGSSTNPKSPNSQACKKVHLLFVMTPGNNVPYVIPVPPGSLQSVRKYLLGLSSKNISKSLVVTSLKLVKDQSSGGIAFSKITPALVTKIPEGLAETVKDYVKENTGAFSRVQVSREDME